MADVQLAVKVDVSGERDVAKLGQSFDAAGKHADTLSTRTIAAGSAIGAFAGGAALELAKAGLDMAVERIGASIELASAKAEAASKVNTLYGNSAAAIAAHAETAADTVNMSAGRTSRPRATWATSNGTWASRKRPPPICPSG